MIRTRLDLATQTRAESTSLRRHVLCLLVSVKIRVVNCRGPVAQGDGAVGPLTSPVCHDVIENVARHVDERHPRNEVPSLLLHRSQTHAPPHVASHITLVLFL